MRIIYGTKVLTEEDLFDTCGRPKNIMDFVKMNVEDTLDELKEARYDYWHKPEYQSNEFKLSFIPIEVIENYVIYKTVEKSMDLVMDYMVTKNGIDMSKLIAEAAKERIDECIDYFADNIDKIPTAVCMIFIHDVKTEIVKDICVAIPKKIIDKIDASTEYYCSKCGFTERADVLPDNMMYTVVDNKVIYFCKPCSRRVNYRTVHVGEEF